MNLPFILDITLGLIFIYLILSLLASEFQELIATLLQWRAQHLRKSIEIFLAGDVQNSQEFRVIQLVNQIYANPLIKGLNQEAKGFLALLPRRLTWYMASISNSFRKKSLKLQFTDTVFGNQKHSGPSYIPSQIFAKTLIESLQVQALVQKLSESRFGKFKEQKLAEIQNILFEMQEQAKTNEEISIFLNKMYQEFTEVYANFEEIIWDFRKEKTNLAVSINHMGQSINKYINSFQTNMIDDDVSNKALERLKFIKQNSFKNIQQVIAINGLQPNVNEVLQSINRGSPVYEEIKEAIQDSDSETFKALDNIIDTLPQSIVQTLTIIAKNSQTGVKRAEEGIDFLRREIETSFNQAMDRASGVYKRNAKGVAIMLGVIIAASSNADAFHMINRLSKDSAIRNTIINNAGEILWQSPQSALNLDALKNQTDLALNDISLPLGWTDTNLKQQVLSQKGGIPVFRHLSIFAGWVLSGIAIAMGAPFWFDILNKIVNVRNSGKPPNS